MYKGFSYLLLFLFFALTFDSGIALAQPFGPYNENVGVGAQVGEEVTVTPGGGGSGSIPFPQTGVRFSGEAYPFAKVTLLKEGEEQVTVTAEVDGKFFITLEEQYSANILYSLIAEDLNGERSLLINYPLVVQSGFLTHLSGIRFPPTISVDKVEAKVNSFITVTGYALPSRELEAVIGGEGAAIFSFTSSTNGTYKIVVPLSNLPKGDYTVSVKYKGDARVSKLVRFSIGTADILRPEVLLNIPGDCNSDRIINLVDFSILAFWYGKLKPPTCVDTNRDGKINLTDFSILAFYWTG
jgi:hypothetical protein